MLTPLYHQRVDHLFQISYVRPIFSDITHMQADLFISKFIKYWKRLISCSYFTDHAFPLTGSSSDVFKQTILFFWKNQMYASYVFLCCFKNACYKFVPGYYLIPRALGLTWNKIAESCFFKNGTWTSLKTDAEEAIIIPLWFFSIEDAFLRKNPRGVPQLFTFAVKTMILV